MTRPCNQPYGQERPDLPKAIIINRQIHISFKRFNLSCDMRSGYIYVKKQGNRGRKLNYLDLSELVAISTTRPAKILKSFGKLLSLKEIIYYINVNYKVGRWLMHQAGAKLSEVAEVVVWCSIYLSLPHLPIAKKDYNSQIAIG